MSYGVSIDYIYERTPFDKADDYEAARKLRIKEMKEH